jgi:hypothetical protein
MKFAIAAFFSLLAITLSAQHATLYIPESQDTVTVSLSQPVKDNFGFSLLMVRVNGHATVFHPKNPLACAPANIEARKHDLDWLDIKGMPFDPSFCFHRAQFGNQAKHTLLAFMSHGFASDSGPAFVLGFQADGTPYKALELDEFDLSAFEASTTDETARIIGFSTLSQVMFGEGGSGSKAPYATTYDPRAVYVISPGEPAKYSLDASRLYNEQRYVWAGPTASETYAVVYNYPGRPKPFGIPAKQLDALFAKLPEKNKP